MCGLFTTPPNRPFMVAFPAEKRMVLSITVYPIPFFALFTEQGLPFPLATCVINTEKLIVRKFCDNLPKNELSHCKRCYNINIVNERGKRCGGMGKAGISE